MLNLVGSYLYLYNEKDRFSSPPPRLEHTAIPEAGLQRGARLTVKDGDFMPIIGEKISRAGSDHSCTKHQTLHLFDLLRSAGRRNTNTRRHPASKRRYTNRPGTQYEHKLAQPCSFGLRCAPTAESPIIEGKNENEGWFYRHR